MEELTTKEIIVKSAFEILSKEGVDKLTTARLIEKAEISKGGLYHHFKEIDEVYLAVMDMLVESFSQGFHELEFEDIDHLNDVLVEALFDELVELKDVYTTLLYFVSRSASKPRFKESLKRWMDKSLKDWGNLYQKYGNGKLSDEKIDTVIRMIDMFFTGLFIHDYILDDIPKYKKITREFLDLMKKQLEL